MRMPNYDVRNDGVGPYAVFYCEKCNREYRSQPDVRATITNDIARQTLGGFLRKIPVVGDAVANSTVQNDPRYTYNLTPDQLEKAWQEIQVNFRECPTCHQVVCLSDFDEKAGFCTEDSPRRAEIAEAQAQQAAGVVKGFAAAFGLDKVAQNIAQAAQTAQASVAHCSKCGTPARAGTKFCPQCGGEMIQPTLATCSGCHQPVPPGVQFCPNCGTKVEAAAPETRTCPKCGATVTSAFCGNCGTKVSP